MPLQIQIQTLLFSFFFGICFSFLLTINYKLIYHEKKRYRISSTFLFIIGSILLYFITIRKINNGIFHPYSALTIVAGVLLEHSLHSFFVKKIAFPKKKWYTFLKNRWCGWLEKELQKHPDVDCFFLEQSPLVWLGILFLVSRIILWISIIYKRKKKN